MKSWLDPITSSASPTIITGGRGGGHLEKVRIKNARRLHNDTSTNMPVWRSQQHSREHRRNDSPLFANNQHGHMLLLFFFFTWGHFHFSKRHLTDPNTGTNLKIAKVLPQFPYIWCINELYNLEGSLQTQIEIDLIFFRSHRFSIALIKKTRVY